MKFFRLVGQNLKNWAAEYTILPLTLASVYGAALFAYFLTGRAPQDSVSWLTDYSARCIVIALAIVFTSVARQSFGVWWTKEELLARPQISVVQTAGSLIIFLACLYVLSH